MKQLIQNLKSGETILENVPAPHVRPGQVLIQTRRSLVSLGTERMLVGFSKANMLTKAWQQPDKVRQMLAKIKTDGWRPTVTAIAQKLDEPLPLGYTAVGTVVAVGEGVADIRLGDRVVSNGPHAEVVCVPRNLVALIPDNVSDDEAVFTVVGSIGLQGIRLLNPTLNETIVVIGLGLIGQLTAQLLRLNGCRVIGIDIHQSKCQLAEQQGITTLHADGETDPVNAVLAITESIGADGVIIAASSQTDELLSQAARMSRQRGRVVLVGTAGLRLNRADFYQKELTFQVACSYGPGRYDRLYEQYGHDYPLAFVRWTENRNFQTILHFLANKQLTVTPLITEWVSLNDYAKVYGTLNAPDRIAALLTYPIEREHPSFITLRDSQYMPGKATVGIIGAGNFTKAILLPALKSVGVIPKTIASLSGLNATLLAKKYAISCVTTDHTRLLNDPDIDLCIISTRHDSHARLAIEAMRAGKHVFVEKPLAIHAHELASLITAQQESERMVMVGFNRRFSPYVQKMKRLLGHGNRLMNIVITVNAGAISAVSWQHDRSVGGGRVLGEVCHFVDLITFLTNSRVQSVCMNAMGQSPSETNDSVSLLLRYANGSTGVINYFSNGNNAYAKERVEVYSQGQVLLLINFRQLKGYGFGRFSTLSGSQNKGHKEQMEQLIQQVQTGGDAPISFDEIINTTQTTLAALQSLKENCWVEVASVGVAQETEKVPELV